MYLMCALEKDNNPKRKKQEEKELDERGCQYIYKKVVLLEVENQNIDLI